MLNIEKIGGKLGIIVDDINELSEEVVMTDDGNGFHVNIPSVFIGK